MTYDLDGAPRIQNGHGTGTPHVDTGAFEYSPDFDGDGTPDWKDPDDDNDGAADVVDCAPHNASVWNAPNEVAPLTLTKSAAVTLEWTMQDPGTSYDIVDGLVLALRADRDFSRASCRAQNLSAPPLLLGASQERVRHRVVGTQQLRTAADDRGVSARNVTPRERSRCKKCTIAVRNTLLRAASARHGVIAIKCAALPWAHCMRGEVRRR